MIATNLTRKGNRLVLRGKISKPFARRPAGIGVERYRSCRRKEKTKVKRVRPNRRGAFTVTFPLPEGARAAIYRARTRVAVRRGGRAAVRTFTLARAIDLG